MKAANDNWKTRIKWGCIGALLGCVLFWVFACTLVSGVFHAHVSP